MKIFSPVELRSLWLVTSLGEVPVFWHCLSCCLLDLLCHFTALHCGSQWQCYLRKNLSVVLNIFRTSLSCPVYFSTTSHDNIGDTKEGRTSGTG